MNAFFSTLKLVRLDSCLYISLAFLIPIFMRSRDLGMSLGRAIPLFFIGMCTFIANDLDDIEKDKINHPERPLPNGHIKPSIAVAIYFTCLMSALLTTRSYIKDSTAFWYYALLALSISYGYVVECFPGFKSLYVASVISIPALILATTYPKEKGLYLVAVSIFLFVLGKELHMDFLDRAGDAMSFMHKINPGPLAATAFSLQLIGLLLLGIQIDEPSDIVVMVLILSLLVLSILYWLKSASYKKGRALMDAQLFIGLYFLVDQ